MEESAIHSDLEKICVLCNTDEEVEITLDCGHSYCLICMSYTNGNNESQVTCRAAGCNKICQLETGSLQAIKTTILQRLIPNINMQELTQITSGNPTDSRSQHSLHGNPIATQHLLLEPPRATPHSLSHSIEHMHITPPTPHSLSKSPQTCQEHPLQECSFVCLTCSNVLLCVRCMLRATHKHNGHNVKTLEKSVRELMEQMVVRRLEINQRVDLLEMGERRLRDKRERLGEKCAKAKLHIVENIGLVIAKAKKKEAELLKACQDHYQIMEIAVDNELDNIKKKLYNLRKFKYDFRKLNQAEQNPSLEFFMLFNKIKAELGQTLSDPLGQYCNPRIQSTVTLKQQDLLQIMDTISRLQICITPLLSPPLGISLGGLSGVGLTSHTTTNQNSVHNITVTNFTSKNTSAERKMLKQHLKTEESQYTRVRTEHIKSAGKLGVRCGSPGGELPSYITKFLDKHGASKGESNEKDSKLSGKFSKSKFSINALDIDHTEDKKKPLMGKKRVERKTTNPLDSLKSQKLIFEVKRTKINK